MVIEPTVLIVGAGASKDYGYPTALELRDTILAGLVTNHRLFNMLRDLGHEREEVERFRNAFRDSSRPSIDAFLEWRDEFNSIGKHSIAAALIPLEDPGKLPRRVPDRWYDYLWDVLEEGDAEFIENRLTVITFNYDRSFEHYFASALRETFNADPSVMALLVKTLNVIHVHGDLGGLPYVDPKARPYLPQFSAERVKEAAERIKIADRWDDGTAPDADFARAQEALRNATRVCFLGFGYNEHNLRRLRFEGNAKDVLSNRSVFGSVFGLTSEETHAAERRLSPSRHEMILPLLGSYPITTYDCLQYLRRAPVFVPR